MDRILVIKHGALGDFVLATGPFTAIRAHHLGDNVTLLTTPPFVDFARQSRLFDRVWVDPRPGVLQVGKWWSLLHRLREEPFARVYDLQTSTRSSFYFRLLARPKPQWSGIAKGASHRHDNPERARMHAVDRQAEQLRVAGIAHVPHPDLSWAKADISH
ncbi:MAG: ADP-heptose--LPS heptosyltransferase, partial [Actinobacteria bacterium]|nr:ADP-heptose--LPS heptosyltransferase [Actinomycetota bacterium]